MLALLNLIAIVGMVFNLIAPKEDRKSSNSEKCPKSEESETVAAEFYSWYHFPRKHALIALYLTAGYIALSSFAYGMHRAMARSSLIENPSFRCAWPFLMAFIQVVLMNVSNFYSHYELDGYYIWICTVLFSVSVWLMEKHRSRLQPFTLSSTGFSMALGLTYSMMESCDKEMVDFGCVLRVVTSLIVLLLQYLTIDDHVILGVYDEFSHQSLELLTVPSLQDLDNTFDIFNIGKNKRLPFRYEIVLGRNRFAVTNPVREGKIKEMEQQLGDTKLALQLKNSAIENLENEIDSKITEMEAVEKELLLKDSAIEKLKNEIQEKMTEMEAMEMETSIKDSAMEKLITMHVNLVDDLKFQIASLERDKWNLEWYLDHQQKRWEVLRSRTHIPQSARHHSSRLSSAHLEHLAIDRMVDGPDYCSYTYDKLERESYWPSEMLRISITGAGGFIASHIASRLKSEGHYIIASDWKKNEHMSEDMFCHEFHLVDLRVKDNCLKVTKEVDHVFNLAADMGGMGFTQSNNSLIMFNNIMISFNMLEAAKINGVERFFYASCACIYPEFKQLEIANVSLKESDAWPAELQDAYSLEKLASEELCKHYTTYFGVECRIGRFHNIYGPFGTWKGGREKAPAAFCRKSLTSTDKFETLGDVRTSTDKFEMLGDGHQTRSFTFIDECVEGVLRLTKSDFREPVNIGSDEMVSMKEMAEIVLSFEGKNLPIHHIPGPDGVPGRK